MHAASNDELTLNPALPVNATNDAEMQAVSNASDVETQAVFNDKLALNPAAPMNATNNVEMQIIPDAPDMEMQAVPNDEVAVATANPTNEASWVPPPEEEEEEEDSDENPAPMIETSPFGLLMPREISDLTEHDDKSESPSDSSSKSHGVVAMPPIPAPPSGGSNGIQ